MSGFVNSIGVCRSVSGFVDSMVFIDYESVCRFYEGVCRFYEGVCRLYGGFVDSVRGFHAQAHTLCSHIYTATSANM